MSQPLIYWLNLGGHEMVVRALNGREALNEPFRFELEMFLKEEQAGLDPDALIKSDAQLVLVRETPERRLSAIVSEISVTETTTGAPVLTVVLEPRFALARFKQNVKAFLHKDVVAIVSEVLGELGVVFSLRLSDSYPVRAYTVQFRETDFHFVSRMLEEEGIFYFFDETGTMILGDNVAAYDDAGALPFRNAVTLDEHGTAVISMGARSRATAGKVTLRDWTEDAPSLPMDVSAAGPTPNGPEHYDFPGEYTDPGAGQRMANIKAEALRCHAKAWIGTSSSARFAPGRTFTLVDTPPGLAAGRFALTAVEHAYERTTVGYSASFEALDGDVVFRPRNLHEEPIVPNPLVGHVTGAGGDDIHCDHLGRVKVHYPWDRLQPKDDTCSHWVPVLQDNNPHSVGTPRVGWEVLVQFMEGDPDRPVVLGRVYNAEDPVYLTLPDKKTVTSLQSLSSPSRDGHNGIEFEDLADNEYIRFHSERNQDVVVTNNRTEHIMNMETHLVERHEDISIGNVEKTDITLEDGSPYVNGSHTLDIGGNRSREVGSSDLLGVGGNLTYTIGGKHTRRIAKTDNVTAKSLTHSVGGVILEASVRANGTSAGIAELFTVGGAVIDIAGADKLEDAAKGWIETIGGVDFCKAKEAFKVNTDDERLTLVGGSKKIKSKEVCFLSANDAFTTLSADQLFSGEGTVTLVVGDSKVTFKGGQIEIKAGSSIKFSLQATSDLATGKSGHN